MNGYTSPTTRFYRHSGKTPIIGLILVGLAGFVAVPILGVIYGVLIRIIPFIYINALIVFGYVYAVGFVILTALKSGKVRNIFLAGVIAFFFGILADYVGWVSWLAVVFGDPLFLIEFFFPWEVLYFIRMVAEQGAWSISGTTPTGGILYAFWAIEAIAVIGGPAYIVTKELSETPFCEESDAWVDKKSQIGVFKPIANPRQFKQTISQGNFAAIFNELKPIQPGDTQFTSLEVHECEHCRKLITLNVNDIKIKLDKKGKAETKARAIISKLMITPHQLADLRKFAAPKAE